jgi:pilus assembly protein Flp/PilA
VLRVSHQVGQGLLEYALIIAIVAVIVIVVLYLIGPAVGNMFSNIIPLI